MAITFSINGTTFDTIGRANLRQALDIVIPAQVYQIYRYKIAGQDGNYKVRDGLIGGVIAVLFRYRGTPAAIGTAFHTDRTAWENTEVVIQDQFGTNFTRCELNSFSQRPLRGLGGGDAEMVCRATFQIDG